MIPRYGIFLFIGSLFALGLLLFGVGILFQSGEKEPLTQDPPVSVLASADQGDHAVPGVRDMVGETGALASSGRVPGAPFYRTRNGLPPAVDAVSAMLFDIRSGETYFTLNENKRWPMASITKLMAASFITDYVNPKSPLTLTRDDLAPLGGDVSKSLHEGESYTVSDLTHAMLIFSSNEAAETVANSYGKTEFLNGLNARAEAWQMGSTYYSDPTGLSAANQSTAADLKIFLRRIYAEYPKLLAISRIKEYYLTELRTGTRIGVQNINFFAGRPEYIGGKTGYTDEAKGNLVSIFEYGGRPVGVIVLGTADRFKETEKLYSWFRANYAAQSL